jgi:hypothetical protein
VAEKAKRWGEDGRTGRWGSRMNLDFRIAEYGLSREQGSVVRENKFNMKGHLSHGQNNHKRGGLLFC